MWKVKVIHGFMSSHLDYYPYTAFKIQHYIDPQWWCKAFNWNYQEKTHYHNFSIPSLASYFFHNVVLRISYKALNGLAPRYIFDLLSQYKDAH